MEYVYIWIVQISLTISLIVLMTSIVLMDTFYYVMDYMFIWIMQICFIISLLMLMALLVLMDTYHDLYKIIYRSMTTQASVLSLVSEID